MDVDDLNQLWCIDCSKCHGLECPLKGPPVVITDTPAMVSRAVASLPKSLAMKTIDGVQQVVAEVPIACRTMFGPLEAPEVEPGKNEDAFVLKVHKKDGQDMQYDTTDEWRCNWMTLVTTATMKTNQNLIIHQYKEALYFTVTRDIAVGEVLRVWYAPHYAATLGKPLLNGSQAPISGMALSKPSESLEQKQLKESPVSSEDVTHAERPDCGLGGEPSVKETMPPSQSETDASTPMETTSSVGKAMDATGSESHDSKNKSATYLGVVYRPQRKKGGWFSKNLTKNVAEYKRIQEKIADECNRSCSDCALILNNPDDLKNHIVEDHHGEPLQCPDCSKILTTDLQLQEHQSVFHAESVDPTSDTDFRCRLCDKAFLSISTFRNHLQAIHSKSFNCRTCKLSYWSRTKFQAHARGHKVRKQDTEKFKCNECPRIVTSQSALKAHKIFEHSKKSFSCMYCKYNAKAELELHEHILNQHPENNLNIPESQILKCDVCSEVFLRVKMFNEHKNTHGKKFKCKKCGAAYSSERAFLRHKCPEEDLGAESVEKKASRKHRKRKNTSVVAKTPKRVRQEIVLSDKEFQQIEKRILEESLRSCSECCLILEDGEALRNHILKEHEEQSVQCPICNKICITKKQLKEHAKVFHTETENPTADTNYKCPLCEKILLHHRTYLYHLQVLHSKTYQCGTCQGSFWNQSRYLEHVSEHKLQGETVGASEMFACGKCDREFTTTSGLRSHETLVHVQKAFSCSHCEYSTGLEVTLQEHILTNHPENNLDIPESSQMFCNVCGAVFLRKNTLNYHMLKHKERQFKCDKCDAVYRKKDSLRRHNCIKARRRMVTSTLLGTVDPDNPTSNVYECQTCLKTFANRASMVYHAATHEEKLYSCDVCNKAFHKRFNFDNHKFQHLRISTNEEGQRELVQVPEGPISSHQCPYCECHFMKMPAFLDHLKTYHRSTTSNIHICTPCDKVFFSPEELTKHAASHVRVPVPRGMTLDELHSCATCGKVFKTMTGLGRHSAIHGVGNTCVCEVCGRTFRRADSLRTHREVHHTNTKKFTCHICNKSFKSSCLRWHMQSHTDQRNYQCPHCGRTFIQRGNFNRHIIIHTQEKTVKCNICNRAFKQEEYLRRHQLVHKNYEFECASCSKKFSTQHFLDNHVRKVHDMAEACNCEYCGTRFKLRESYRNHMKRKHPEVLKQDFRPVMESSQEALDTLEGIIAVMVTEGEQSGIKSPTKKGNNTKKPKKTQKFSPLLD